MIGSFFTCIVKLTLHAIIMKEICIRIYEAIQLTVGCTNLSVDLLKKLL